MSSVDDRTNEIRVGKLVFLVTPHFKADDSENISDKLKNLLKSETKLINMRENA